jgi:hypothetical protein
MAVIQITGIFGAGGHEGLAINKEGDVMSWSMETTTLNIYLWMNFRILF